MNIVNNTGNRFLSRFGQNQCAAVLSLLGFTLVSFGAGQRVVYVKPGDNVQELVQNSPPGTAFNFKSGVYRLLEIKPKNQDSFIGDGSSAILSGAVVLKEFQRDGSFFRARYDPPKEQLAGSCAKDHPMCKYPEDCFLDNAPLRRVAGLADVGPGAWFLDYSNREAVIGDDPTGHSLEISTARSAFSGIAADVLISGLTVEKYAIPAQMGAIGDQSAGTGWQIAKCTVRWNHGTGIQVADDSVVTENKILQNGQKGLGAHGNNVLVRGNEIASNNYAGFSDRWEAGGTKFARTTNLKVIENNVHDNIGPGLWTDIDNHNTLYQGNKVVNNSAEGIKHEISFSASIRDNAVSGNGRALSVFLWGSQILIQNSSDVDVGHNTIIVPRGFGNGIGIIIQNRGKYVAADNFIHDNDITYLDPVRGASGVACDYEPAAASIPRNRFENNHYHVTEQGRHHWLWKTGQTWESLRETGQEIHGTVDNAAHTPHDIAVPSPR